MVIFLIEQSRCANRSTDMGGRKEGRKKELGEGGWEGSGREEKCLVPEKEKWSGCLTVFYFTRDPGDNSPSLSDFPSSFYQILL